LESAANTEQDAASTIQLKSPGTQTFAGWMELQDNASGRMYYWNKELNKTVWKCPPEYTKAKDEAANHLKRKQKQEGPVVDAGTCAAGWVSHADKSSGRVYFHNKAQEKTVWACPPEMRAAIEAQKMEELQTQLQGLSQTRAKQNDELSAAQRDLLAEKAKARENAKEAAKLKQELEQLRTSSPIATTTTAAVATPPPLVLPRGNAVDHI